MNLKISATSKMMALSVAFLMSLLLVRFYYSHSVYYGFYVWNSFLAIVPYVISTRLLKQKKPGGFSIALIVLWLVFLPNAPYLVTDLFHYEERSSAPYWYDLFIVVTAAWNGLLLGMISLMNVEQFLSRHLKPIWVTTSVFCSLLLCSYGIFIGRFLRFNSWDIVTEPGTLAYTSAHHVLLPQQYPKLWVFTILFSVLLTIVYFTLKKLPRHGSMQAA
ncbi:MAG: DUF1361 domain-containing protein [Bacteroidota bacterium]